MVLHTSGRRIEAADSQNTYKHNINVWGWTNGEVTRRAHYWSWDRTCLPSEYLPKDRSYQSGSNPSDTVVENRTRMDQLFHTLPCWGIVCSILG